MLLLWAIWLIPQVCTHCAPCVGASGSSPEHFSCLKQSRMYVRFARGRERVISVMSTLSQVSMVVSCLGPTAGRGRMFGVCSFNDVVRTRCNDNGIQHFVWQVSNPHLGLIPVFCIGRFVIDYRLNRASHSGNQGCRCVAKRARLISNSSAPHFSC